MGQGPQTDESAVDQAGDGQISDFLRDKSVVLVRLPVRMDLYLL